VTALARAGQPEPEQVAAGQAAGQLHEHIGEVHLGLRARLLGLRHEPGHPGLLSPDLRGDELRPPQVHVLGHRRIRHPGVMLSLTQVVPGRAGAALTKPGRASTARWCGSGERGGKEYARNRRYYVLHKRHRLEPGGSGPGAARPAGRDAAGTSGACWLPRAGRPRGRSAAYSWRGRWDTAGLLLRRANDSEHGNRPGWFPAAGIRPAGRDRRADR